MALQSQIILEAQKKCAGLRKPFISVDKYGLGEQYTDSFLSFLFFPFKILYNFVSAVFGRNVMERSRRYGEIGTSARVLPFLPLFLDSSFKEGQDHYLKGKAPQTQTNSSLFKDFAVFMGAALLTAGLSFLIAYLAGFSFASMVPVLISSSVVATMALGTYTAKQDYYNRGYDTAVRESRDVRDDMCITKIKEVCVAMQKEGVKDFAELYKVVHEFDDGILLEEEDKEFIKKFIAEQAVGDLLDKASGKVHFISGRTEYSEIEKKFNKSLASLKDPSLKGAVQEYCKDHSFDQIAFMYNSKKFIKGFIETLRGEVQNSELSTTFRDKNPKEEEKKVEISRGWG